MPRKQSTDYDDYSSPPQQGGESGPIPGYYDQSLIDNFAENYSPGSHQHCDIIMTEPMLRELFNAQRDQDMTFTDPWILYKDSLLHRGYRLIPNADLQTSVMYLIIIEPELLEDISL